MLIGSSFWIAFFLWYVCIMYGNNVIVMFLFCLSLLPLFLHVTITFFTCSMQFLFLATLELRYILARSNYLRRSRYKMSHFSVTLKRRLVISSPSPRLQVFLEFDFWSEFNHSFDESNARFYNDQIICN